MARFRAPIIDPELQTKFDNLDDDEDFIDYCALIGNCAIAFDDEEDIEHIAAKVMTVMSESYSGDIKQAWDGNEDGDLNVNCKVSDDDMNEITEFVEDWLDENPEIKKAILVEYRKRSFKGKTPASASKQ